MPAKSKEDLRKQANRLNNELVEIASEIDALEAKQTRLREQLEEKQQELEALEQDARQAGVFDDVR